MSYSQAIYRQDDSIVSRRIEDEVILVPIRQRTADLEGIYTLNETGSRIWELIDGSASLGQICAVIADEYEISREQAGLDLEEFIVDLESFGALRRVS